MSTQVKNPSGKTRMTPAVAAEAQRLLDEGHSKTDVAEKLNVWPSSLTRFSTTRDDRRKAQMRELRNQGLTLEEIGARFDISKQAVSAILGPKVRRAKRGQRRMVDLAPERWEGLREEAQALGLLYADGGIGGRGSIDLMLDAIGGGEIALSWKSGSGPDQVGDPES